MAECAGARGVLAAVVFAVCEERGGGMALAGQIAALLGLAAGTVWAAVIDARSSVIPNRCVATLALWWLAVAWALPGGYAAGIAGALVAGGFMLVAALIFERFSGEFALGGGDVKLVATFGLYLGAEGALLAVLLACVFFLVAALFRRRAALACAPASSEKLLDATCAAAFPFGPALAAGALPVAVARFAFLLA